MFTKHYSPEADPANAGGGEGTASQENSLTETVKVNGIEATIFFKEDGAVEKIGVPPDMTDEQKKAWRESEKTSNEISALALAHGKNRESKVNYQAMVELTERNEKALSEMKALQEESKRQPADKSTVNNPTDLRAVLGVKTYDEVLEIQNDDPERYFEAQRKVIEATSNMNLQHTMTSTTLLATVKAEGYDPTDVVNYAKKLGAPLSADLFDAYKSLHRKPTTSRSDVIAGIQSMQIPIVSLEGANPNDGGRGKRSVESMLTEKANAGNGGIPLDPHK